MKSGDHDSFSLIFKFYYPLLYSYGIKLVPLSDFVRDQIQDLFIGIWQSKDSLGDISNLKAYLFVSLRRRLFAEKKSNLNTDSLEEVSKEDFRSLVFEPGEFLDKEYVSGILKEKLVANLNSLPLAQREIIFFRFLHQLTYKEIANILNVNEQSVKNIMPKILQKLSAGITDISTEDLGDIDILLFNLFMLLKK